MAKLTKTFVDTVDTPESGFTIIWDDDLKGFGARVMSSGTITFLVDYRNKSGIQRRLSIGRYGVITPKEARKKAKRILNQVAEDKDPLETRAKSRKAPTFKMLAEEYITRRCSEKKSGHEDERIIHKDLIKPWGRIPAKDIGRRDVIELIDGIKDRGAGIMANRTLSVIKRMYNFGIDRELVEVNPAARVKPPAKENRRDRVLDEKEIKTLWKQLPKVPGSPLTLSALKLILVTAQRPGEVVSTEWSEIDIDAELWMIPAEKSKNGLAHRVPLSPVALGIINELGPGEGYIFSSPIGSDRCLTAHSMSRLLNRNRDLLKIDHFTPHDLRRTAASHMASMGISRLVIAKILNHVETGVTAIYDRHGYDNEKREALNAWSAKLEQIIEGKKGKVVPIRR